MIKLHYHHQPTNVIPQGVLKRVEHMETLPLSQEERGCLRWVLDSKKKKKNKKSVKKSWQIIKENVNTF